MTECTHVPKRGALQMGWIGYFHVVLAEEHLYGANKYLRKKKRNVVMRKQYDSILGENVTIYVLFTIYINISNWGDNA